MRQLVMALVLGSSCVAAASHAHEAGDFLVRVGVAQVAPDASSGSVLGGGVDVEDATGLGFSGTWFATPHIGIEVLAALPFEHDIVGSGALSGVDIGSTKHLPPTLSLQYHFQPQGQIRPYVGAGINYTRFSSVDLPAGFTIEKNSFGPSLQAGVDIEISKGIFLNFDVKKTYIRTDLKSNGTKLGTIKVDPVLLGVGVGYRF